MSAGQSRSPNLASSWPYNIRLILFALITLCVLFIFSYSKRLEEKAQLQAEIKLWQERVEQDKAQKSRLEAEVKQVDTPEYVDEVARRELNVSKPGDKILILYQVTPEPTVIPTATPLPPTPLPRVDEQANWRRWLELFISDPTLEGN
jgi:cell division protein FtsB